MIEDMTTRVHPKAIVEPGAQLSDGVEVGAYAYVGGSVVIGTNCCIHHHGIVQGKTILGEENEIFPFAFIGGKTQDLKFRDGNPPLCIGNRNVFREYVSVHCATSENTTTIIGNDNYILAYAHIAHECVLQDHIIVSSQVVLGGHVQIDSFANIGGSSAIHQFCRVGMHAMLGGGSALVQDIPPFMIAEGNRARVRAYNKVGLERHGFSVSEIEQVRHLFRLIHETILPIGEVLEVIRDDARIDEKIKEPFLRFYGNNVRGISR
ncbi:MAG: acyl-ACP--UDP-N-acetylglucosamine O-acyltransferase [Puniceicoccales bacterium]|jgi:UDP-N-acetylglucosamine acyltransferase|nr:acyl-ACP--UDP-N-acetylglucosamine O-acyltransferase [Puniceicoccales bacterium]